MPAAQNPGSDVAVLVVAAGRGYRAGGDLPKQYRTIAGCALLRHTLRAFLAHPFVGRVLVAIHPDDASLYAEATAGLDRIEPPCPGGADRQASCLAGLRALARSGAPDIVLIHDAAGPFVSSAVIDRAIAAARRHGAAVPGIAVTDTVKQVAENGRVVSTPERRTLRAVQTPQAFDFRLALDSHERAEAAGLTGLTDDGAVVEWAGVPLHVFDGDPANFKITQPEDFDVAEQKLNELAALGDVRTGTGFDVHAFTQGDHVWLNGVRIAHDKSLSGHSDADVGLHALTDAILGAIADGDIGSHFPPSDPQWKGASSDRFLAHAVERVQQRGGAVAHLDVTILCEEPKIGPHRDTMRARIAAITGLDIGRIGVKATTMEQLGFVGRREGIAAMASATVRLPWSTP